MRNQDIIDVLSIASFVIGLQNLDLNSKQVASLDDHLAKQDDILVKQQNTMLEEILGTLKEIKNALEID